jgi:hypothetical protein
MLSVCNSIKIALLSLSVASPLLITAHGEKIILESKILQLVDGSFFTADHMRQILLFQREITKLTMGYKMADGTRVAPYLFRGQHHTIIELAEIEKTIERSKQMGTLTLDQQEAAEELKALLITAKLNFISLSNQFRDSGRMAKSLTTVLMRESCEKRERHDSLLLLWANTTPETENSVLRDHANTFGKFLEFQTDLFNFLTDLRNSCPKAYAKFQQQFGKLKAVKRLLPHALKKAEVIIDENAFLAYLRATNVNDLDLKLITIDRLRELLIQFSQRNTLLEDDID